MRISEAERRVMLMQEGWKKEDGMWIQCPKMPVPIKTQVVNPLQYNVQRHQPIDNEWVETTFVRAYYVLLVPRLRSQREMDWHRPYPTMRINITVRFYAGDPVVSAKYVPPPSIDELRSQTKISVMRIIRPTEAAYIEGKRRWEKLRMFAQTYVLPPEVLDPAMFAEDSD